MMLRSAMFAVLLSIAAATCGVTCDHSSGLVIVSHGAGTAATHRCWVNDQDTCTCECPDIMQVQEVTFEISVAGMTAIEVQSAIATIAQAIADALGIAVSDVTITIGTSRRLIEGTTVTLDVTVTASDTAAGSLLETAITATTFADAVVDELPGSVPATLTVDAVIRSAGGVAQPAPLCPASYTLPFATTTIALRTLGATASAACAISELGDPTHTRRYAPSFTFNSPTLNLRNVEATLGGSGNVGNNADSTTPLPLCGGDDGSSHANQQHLAERFCSYHGYTSASNVQIVAQSGNCAVYHESGNGSRVAALGDKISSITCGNVLGRGVFSNPTINIDQAEATLGGSGDPAAYLAAKPNHAAPDSTTPYLLCAGNQANGELDSHGAGHTNTNHIAARFCELEGYTSAENIQTVAQTSDYSDCAVYHNDGTGRRYDNSHFAMISQITCTDPAPYVAPVLTCQANGSWEADRSCRCSAADQTFNDPTVNIFALEQELGGSGDPAAYNLNTPKNAAPDSQAPYLLCAGNQANGEFDSHGAGGTNQNHMADRFCMYHGYPGGHVSIQTVAQDGDCAVYHNDGAGRRYDSKHSVMISQIVCVGQCAAPSL